MKYAIRPIIQQLRQLALLATLSTLLGIVSLPAASAQMSPPVGPQYPPRAIGFDKRTLSGESLQDPTSLQWGPDDRLYVSEQKGKIFAFTIARDNVNNTYAVTATEIITLVRDIPNYVDNGTLSAPLNERQVTGIYVTGTFHDPVLYVTSSDPRKGYQGDTNLDTNSGTISRLTRADGVWSKVDLVRGLPRSEEYHSINGLVIDDTTNTLYVMNGGSTNKGAPGLNFSCTAEYVLSGALLSVDLDVINALPVLTDGNGQQYVYDLPTLDDPTRGTPGQPDNNDPFGGNDGLNQAMMVVGGPVQVYSPGYRNAYDIVLSEAGKLYTYDNGPNTNWGGMVVGEGTTGTCTNEPRANGAQSDGYDGNMHYISGPGYYAGHPNPTRANPSGANLYRYVSSIACETTAADTIYDFDAIGSPVPLSMINPVECDYRAPLDQDSNGTIDDGSIAQVNASANGMTEYTASNFANEMKGNLLTAAFDGKVYRQVLSPGGDTVTAQSAQFSAFGSQPLDITAQGDLNIFPGTVWAATYGADNITIFDPTDLIECAGTDDPGLDEDFDLFDNADEIDNGTNPCSGGHQPDDNDGDFDSDLNDLDDDNDLVLDLTDAFQIDNMNGTVGIPFEYPFYNNDPGTGFFGLGFTGLMTNGVNDYLTMYTPSNLTAGGAVGKFTVDFTTAGDATGAANTQQNAFQMGVDVDQNSAPFYVETQLDAPFFSTMPTNGQLQGMTIGTGDQSTFVRLALVPNGGAGAIQVTYEADDAQVYSALYDTAITGNLLGQSGIVLRLYIDTAANTVTPFVRGANSVMLPSFTVNDVWLTVGDNKGMALGVIASSGASGVPFTATWDYLRGGQTPSALVIVDPNGGSINNSTFTANSFTINNTATGGQKITSVQYQIAGGLLPDMAFDPNGDAGDTVAKPFTPDSGEAATGLTGHSFADPLLGGFQTLNVNFNDFNNSETFGFSIDVDPTSIQGTGAPGPGESGSISGFELIGALVTITWDDGTSYTGTLYRRGTTLDGSQFTLQNSLPAKPTIELLGISENPTTVNSPNQTVRITGTIGANVKLLIAEAA
ncbi:MAG: hypothetical protein H7Y11_08535, partial [Armatimonadetes bacterium]|nr:hypothetical protein [Anaerolineae bacterium]